MTAAAEISIGLMLRSAPQERVSKHGAAPSFETAAPPPPLDEADTGLNP